jgi:Entner-Doudoroff aldolase
MRRGFSTGLDRMQSRESYTKVIEYFATQRACAVLRTPTAEAAPKAMTAAIEGGFKNIEFTLTTPGCLDCVTNFRTKHDGTVMVGCGTVMCVEDAEKAIDAGSQYIVAPIMMPDVIQWCAARNIVCIPGCATPTELYNAYLNGAPLQKVFPGVAGGPMWVKAVAAALPMLRINPTSGVDLDNAGEFLKNGAASVGLVAPLFSPEDIATSNWDSIQAKAERVMANVREAGPLLA